MAIVLVDTNVIVDYLDEESDWADWSASMLASSAETGSLVINPIIYAEVSVGFDDIDEVEDALPADYFVRADLPWEAAFLAARCFEQYRRRGGTKQSPLPDFFIG